MSVRFTYTSGGLAPEAAAAFEEQLGAARAARGGEPVPH